MGVQGLLTISGDLQKESQFFARIKKNRVDPSNSSTGNPGRRLLLLTMRKRCADELL